MKPTHKVSIAKIKASKETGFLSSLDTYKVINAYILVHLTQRLNGGKYPNECYILLNDGSYRYGVGFADDELEPIFGVIRTEAELESYLEFKR